MNNINNDGLKSIHLKLKLIFVMLGFILFVIVGIFIYINRPNTILGKYGAQDAMTRGKSVVSAERACIQVGDFFEARMIREIISNDAFQLIDGTQRTKLLSLGDAVDNPYVTLPIPLNKYLKLGNLEEQQKRGIKVLTRDNRNEQDADIKAQQIHNKETRDSIISLFNSLIDDSFAYGEEDIELYNQNQKTVTLGQLHMFMGEKYTLAFALRYKLDPSTGKCIITGAYSDGNHYNFAKVPLIENTQSKYLFYNIAEMQNQADKEVTSAVSRMKEYHGKDGTSLIWLDTR